MTATASPAPARLRAAAPPGPAGLPPGPRLPRVVQTVLFARWRPWFLTRSRRRYGDAFTVRVWPGRTFVVLADVEDVRAAFAASTTLLHAGEGNAVLEPAMGARSVLLVDEDEHRRIRRLLMPAFHGAPLAGYRELVARLARDDVARWPAGVPTAVHDHTARLTRDVILGVVFGVTDPERLAELLPPVDRIVRVGVVVTLGLVSPLLRRLPPWNRFARVQRVLDRLLYAEIARRRTEPDLAARPDVLSQLVRRAADGTGLTDREIRDNLLTLLLAGHETTATSLAWTLHELARRPDVQDRARRAADTGDEVYLEAVVKEALRLRPVIYEVARLTTDVATVGGWTVPAGVRVLPALGLVQSDPAHFPDPHRFDPDRFLGAGPAPGTWIPFGGGTRRCLGAAFSLMESVVVLGEVLRRYRVDPVGRRPEAAHPRTVTLAPARGAQVVLSPRRPAEAVGG